MDADQQCLGSTKLLPSILWCLGDGSGLYYHGLLISKAQVSWQFLKQFSVLSSFHPLAHARQLLVGSN